MITYEPVLKDPNTGDVSHYNVALSIIFRPGNEVFYVTETFSIIYTVVQQIHLRLLRDADLPVVTYGCQQKPKAAYNEYPADRLFGTMQEAVTYVKEQLTK